MPKAPQGGFFLVTFFLTSKKKLLAGRRRRHARRADEGLRHGDTHPPILPPHLPRRRRQPPPSILPPLPPPILFPLLPPPEATTAQHGRQIAAPTHFYKRNGGNGRVARQPPLHGAAHPAGGECKHSTLAFQKQQACRLSKQPLQPLPGVRADGGAAIAHTQLLGCPSCFVRFIPYEEARLF